MALLIVMARNYKKANFPPFLKLKSLKSPGFSTNIFMFGFTTRCGQMNNTMISMEFLRHDEIFSIEKAFLAKLD